MGARAAAPVTAPDPPRPDTGPLDNPYPTSPGRLEDAAVRWWSPSASQRETVDFRDQPGRRPGDTPPRLDVDPDWLRRRRVRDTRPSRAVADLPVPDAAAPQGMRLSAAHLILAGLPLILGLALLYAGAGPGRVIL